MTAAVDPQFSRPAVYALLDPASGAVRYIGKSVNPRKRYIAHIERARKGADTHQYRWIRTLLRRNRTPIMITLQSADDLDKAERFWIRYHRERGADLTNLTDEYKQQRESGIKVVCRRKPYVYRAPTNLKPRQLCIICATPVPDRPSRPGSSSERKTCSRTCYSIRRSQWTSPNKGAGREHPCITCGAPCPIKRKTCSTACHSKHLSERAVAQHANGSLRPPPVITHEQPSP